MNELIDLLVWPLSHGASDGMFQLILTAAGYLLFLFTLDWMRAHR